MLIETSRCIVRKMKPDDAKELYETLSDSEVMKYIEEPFSLVQTEEFIEEAGMDDDPLVYALVLKESGKVIGHVIFHQYDEEAYEVGWIINRAHWNQGIASEVTAGLIQYARQNEIPALVIECDPEQETTIKLAKKFGFVYVTFEDECNVYRLECF